MLRYIIRYIYHITRRHFSEDNSFNGCGHENLKCHQWEAKSRHMAITLYFGYRVICSERKYCCWKVIHRECLLCGYPMESWVHVKWSTVKPLECHLSVTPSFHKAALFSSHKSTQAGVGMCTCEDCVTLLISTHLYMRSVCQIVTFGSNLLIEIHLNFI
jgi:hypothetical protein